MLNTNSQLPDRVGELLLLAYQGVNKVTNDPDNKYLITMLHRHKPYNGRTYLSLGGVILATRFGIPPDKEIPSYNHLVDMIDISETDLLKLEALDQLATGRPESAFRLVGREYPRNLNLTITNYRASPKAFKEDLKRVGKTLKHHNI